MDEYLTQKFQMQTKASSCHLLCTSSKEADSDVTPLTDPEEETVILAAEIGTPLVAET